jgi:polyhydroxyalkanoate synthesis regulator phasin
MSGAAWSAVGAIVAGILAMLPKLYALGGKRRNVDVTSDTIALEAAGKALEMLRGELSRKDSAVERLERKMEETERSCDERIDALVRSHFTEVRAFTARIQSLEKEVSDLRKELRGTSLPRNGSDLEGSS